MYAIFRLTCFSEQCYSPDYLHLVHMSLSCTLSNINERHILTLHEAGISMYCTI